MRNGTVAALAILTLSIAAPRASLIAQQPGDFYVYESLASGILTAPRGGNATTLATFPTGSVTAAMTEGPDDGSAIAVFAPPTAVPRLFVNRIDRTGLTTLSSLISFPLQGTDDIDLDDAGDLLLLSRLNLGQPEGIYRMPLTGATTVSLVVPVPLPAMTVPVAFAEDAATGFWWVLDSAAYLHRVSAGSSVLSITRFSSTSIRAGGLAVDAATDSLLVAAGNAMMRFDVNRPSITTLVSLGFPQGGAEALDVAIDPATGDYLMAGWQGFGPGTFGFVHEVDRTGTITRTASLGSPVRAQRMATVLGRTFTPLGPPATGTTYRVRLRVTAEAGVGYQAALAFSTRPGIQTPSGRIPLSADPLFFLSVSGVPIFQGFSGTLDAAGGATLSIAIPNSNALDGLRVALAAVTFDPNGIRRVVGPFGFTLR